MWDRSRSGKYISLTNYDLTATMKLDANIKNCWNGIIGTRPLLRYSVKLKHFVTGHIMIGMVPSKQFNGNGPNYDKCGYYVEECDILYIK